MTKQFTPGSVVRVTLPGEAPRLMGVGQASLRGWLEYAEDINDIAQADVIAAQQGTTSADLSEAVDVDVALTPGQKAAATRAANKAAKEAEAAAAAEAEAKAKAEAEEAEAKAKAEAEGEANSDAALAAEAEADAAEASGEG